MSTVWLEMPKQRSNGAKPQRRDPAATRRKLLTAARREFARSGLAGARVDEIAARAGVNKQLVYHYFGDKDALYLAVLEWVYEEIRAQERKLNLEGLPPERAIRKLIESSFDHLALHPDFIVLLNDENRNGARHVRASLKIEDMHSPLVSMVSKYILSALSIARPHHAIGVGMWLALIMAYNVWFIIWPNQKKALGIVQVDADAKAKAARMGMLASRFNTMLSIPMLYCMVAQQNGGLGF